jgi:hypothetical protein
MTSMTYALAPETMLALVGDRHIEEFVQVLPV